MASKNIVDRIEDAVGGFFGFGKSEERRAREKARAARKRKRLLELIPVAARGLETLQLEISDRIFGFAGELARDIALAQDKITDLVVEAAPGNKEALKLIDDLVDLPFQIYLRAWIFTFDTVLENNKIIRENIRRQEKE